MPEDETVNVDSPTTHNHYHGNGAADLLKPLLLAGSLAMAGTGVGGGIAAMGYFLSQRPTADDTVTDIKLGGGTPVHAQGTEE